MQSVPGALPLAILISHRRGFKTFKIYINIFDLFLYFMQSVNTIISVKSAEDIAVNQKWRQILSLWVRNRKAFGKRFTVFVYQTQALSMSTHCSLLLEKCLN
ncbi:MAG: hypothetical protein DRR19_01560 [Candidatus Parabeggiatoa sp. nov. 1]|nr:MAG: hypothetical protein DRR19_01560 [Gammaproteobacteria bacterium]